MEYKDPYKEFGEELDRFIWSVFEAFRIRDVLEWLTNVLSKIK
jgi:hypothetical protein